MQYNFSTFSSREYTNAQKYTLREKLFKTKDVLPLWIADMDINTPKFILDAIQDRLKHPNFGYEAVPQSAFLAQKIWMKKNHNFDFEIEDMLYSHSVVATMNLVIETFSNIGDKIIVQPPVYPPFFNSIVQHKREVVKNPLKLDIKGRYSFDIDDLIAKIDDKTKILFLCSPHNPVGRVWRRDELNKILQVCIEHNIIVFSDEIHSDLVYKPNKHIPFATLSNEARDITITALGIGKTFNTAGFAMSTVIITNQILRDKFLKFYNRIHFAQGCSLSHVAFESAYQNGHDWLRELLNHLKQNYEILKEVCTRYDDKFRLTDIEASYLAWIDCSGMQMSNKALKSFFVNKAKLGLSSGLSFGREGDCFIRLNFAVSSEVMLEIRDRLLKSLGEEYGKN